MLTDKQRRFLDAHPVARLATADPEGQPHVLPICYAIVGDHLCFTIDEKPKRQDKELKRLVNLRLNPKAAVVVDCYHDDWSKLGWVLIQGTAKVLADGNLHDRAQQALRERYPQLKAMRIDDLPVVAISIGHVTSWGQLDN